MYIDKSIDQFDVLGGLESMLNLPSFGHLSTSGIFIYAKGIKPSLNKNHAIQTSLL